MVGQLYWRVNGMDHAMMAVLPAELMAARKQCPDLIGTPYIWTMIGDEVHWYPDSLEGMPVVQRREVT